MEHPINTLAAPLTPVSTVPAAQGDPLARLTPADRALFRRFGWGKTALPRAATLLAAFEAMAARQPDAVAIEWQGQTITYATLNREADRLARVLAAQGVIRGDTVCLYLKRSIQMVVGQIAIMKLGAAYAPQHVGVATDHVLRHVARATAAPVILTMAELAGQVHVDGQKLIAIETVLFNPALDATPVAAQPPRAGDTAMVLFTSGTTGTPNGVRVTHGNLVNILLTAPGDLSIRPGTRVGQILSIAFDMSAWEVWGCLCNGGTLVIRGASIQDTAERVDVLIATPSILASLDDSRCRGVQVAAVAGEPCPRPLADRWGAFCTFYNSCGPTETTIVNTAEVHSPTKPILSIGRPTPNNTVYILDEDLNPLPIGAKGEMWAGGDCVTAGYIGNDALNAERYRPDPFLGGGRMMFRTRDLGRWTETGELEHFGRVDDQVKVRGFRVELDGVSAALENAPDVTRAVTLKYDDRNLVAFLSPACADPTAALARCEATLPYYAVPVAVIPLPELPRTARGKIDKALLMDIARTELTGAKEAAQ